MIDHVGVIDTSTRRTVELARSSDLAAPVPSCPGWSLADLVWHLAGVQHFWTHIVATRASSPDGYDEPPRPPDAELADLLDLQRAGLVAALEQAEPGDPCWSWGSEQTVGFTLRMQTHEATYHRVDAELAAGRSTAIDAELAEDGVNHLLTIMLSDLPSWSRFEPSDDSLRLVADGTGRSWTAVLGRMVGTSPDTGRDHDLAAIVLDDTATPSTTVSGPSEALARWVWGRGPIDPLTIDGPVEVAAALRDIAADGSG